MSQIAATPAVQTLAANSGPPHPRWLYELGLGVDAWGNSRREQHARRTAQRPGYGVLETDDGLVRYRMHGEGPALVFMTDPPITLENYDALVAALIRDYRVIVLETPGFGFSTLSARMRADYSFAHVNDSMLKLLRALGHAPYLLAFPCAMAYSALSVAARAPELVSGLVLSQAPCWSEMLRWKARVDPTGILSLPVLGQLALRATRRKRITEWLAVAAGSPDKRREFGAAADRSLNDGAGFALASGFQNLLVGTPDLPPVATKTLFVWGLRDRSHALTDRASSLLQAPGARLLEAPHLGHFPELEDPAWFAQTLRDFTRA